MDLKVKTVPLKSEDNKKIKEIYVSSFSKEDRMPFWLMLIMAKLKSTAFLSFHDGQDLCGFIYMATIKNLTFIMFFVVDESIRSKGYGSRILDKVQTMYPNNKIIVSIERCDEDSDDREQRIRRKNFYAKNGYMETGYAVELGNKKQELLIKNGVFNKREFILFFLRYSNFTMAPKIFRIGS